jgi:hypothetical protein
MPSRNGQFFFFDALPFLCPLSLDLLRRRRVGMVGAASGIGTNLDDLSALAAVHDDGLSHLVTGFLNGWQFSACPVLLCFLHFQLDVLIATQESTLAGAKSG